MAKVHFLYFDLYTGYYPSLHHGLAYLLGALKNEGHMVSLSHLVSEDDYEMASAFLEDNKFDLIGLSFTTNQKGHARTFLDMKKLSASLIVAGGVHCSLVREEVFNEFPEFDGICIGEGENSLVTLCRCLDKNENYLTTPSFYFKVDDKVINNPLAPLREIDTLKLPDYSLFDYRKIISDGGGYFPMMLSRGCPYDCYNCCNHIFKELYRDKDKYVRFPSVEHAIKIIKNNLVLYPEAQKIIFADDTFTLNKRWLSDFCTHYSKEIGLPYSCNARVETIDDEIAQCLKDSGCLSVNFGVETGNEWLRGNILNRRHSNEKIKESFRIIKKYGIKAFSFNMIGLPFETKEMARETLQLNLELKPDFGKCFYFYPYPGTRLRQVCSENDLFGDGLKSVSGYLEAPVLKGKRQEDFESNFGRRNG